MLIRGGPPTLPVASGRPRRDSHRRAEENVGLVHAVLTRRFPLLLRDAECAGDAFAAGYLELLRAAERYDPDRPEAFSSYATRCVFGGVHHWLRQERRQRRVPTLSLDAPPFDDDEDGVRADRLLDPAAEAPFREAEERAHFATLLAGLGPRHRRLLTALYRDGKTLEEAAGDLGVSRARAGQLRAQAVKELRTQAATGWPPSHPGAGAPTPETVNAAEAGITPEARIAKGR